MNRLYIFVIAQFVITIFSTKYIVDHIEKHSIHIIEKKDNEYIPIVLGTNTNMLFSSNSNVVYDKDYVKGGSLFAYKIPKINSLPIKSSG